MIENSETNLSENPMFLGRKLRNRRSIPSEDFFRDHQIFATEIKFCSPKWFVKRYLGLESGPRYEKG